MYPNGEKAQLDYILGRKKWRNTFKNCQSYNSFDSISFDHRIVSCKVKISYRQSKPSPKRPLSKIDWKAVLCDNDLQNRYAADVYNRYEALSKQMTEPSTDDRCEALIAANAEVAENILPKKSWNLKSTRGTRANLQSAKESLDKAYSKQLDQHISTKTAQTDQLQAERQSAKAWETIRERTNKKSSPLSKVKGDTKKVRLKTWYDHLKSLLGPEPPDVDISDDYFNRKIQIIFLLLLANLLWRNLISASQNSPKAKHLALKTYLQWYGNILSSKTSSWHSVMKL